MKEHIHAIHRENVETLSAYLTNDLRLIVVKLSHTNPNHINNEKKERKQQTVCYHCFVCFIYSDK